MKWLVPLGVSLVTSTARAAVSDPALTETPFAQTAPSFATGMAWAPDGSERLFVTHKRGTVAIIEKGVLLAAPFATLSPIHFSTECGLLGLAFDPEFSLHPYVYVFVTVAPDEQRIVRYDASGNVGSSETIIVSDLPTTGSNHCGGGVGFGQDGKLYFTVGDGGAGLGVGDDLASLHAKIGRVNRDGTVPSDNPFVDGPGPNADLVWGRGFRNAFSLTFQPATERLFVNVVGTQYEQVFVPRAGDHAGWNDYENDQPAGYITPIIAYHVGSPDVRTVTAATRTAGVATFSTTTAHRFRVGTKVTVAGVTNATFDAAAFVSAIPSDTEFSVVQSGPDAISTGGAASTLSIGRAITGGTFWSSSGVPSSHRGNFFFGDYASGNLVRATLGGGNSVTSVDLWGNSETPIDMDIGPDGDLYHLGHRGIISRVSYNFASQALVVSRLHLRVTEGGSAAFHVRLGLEPGAPVQVSVGSTSADLSVAEGSTLTFGASNGSVPAVVRVTAGHDADSVEGAATVTVSAAGLTAEDVEVRITDDDPLGLTVSERTLALDEGQTGTFEVSLSGPPASALTVNVDRTAGDADIVVSAGAVLSFDQATWATPQTVTVAALDDPDLENDSTTLTATANGLGSVDVEVTVNDGDADATAGAGGLGGEAGRGGAGGGCGDSGPDGAAGQSGTPKDGSGPGSQGCGCRLRDPRGTDGTARFSAICAIAALLQRRRGRSRSLGA